MKPEHHLGRKLDEIDLKHLGDERERSGSPKVTFYHLNLVILCQELNIERTRDIQSAGNSPGNLLNATNSLYVKLLRRELDRGIARVHASIFNML